MGSRLLACVLLGTAGALAGAGIAEWTSRGDAIDEAALPSQHRVPAKELEDPWPAGDPDESWVPQIHVLRHPARPPTENERREEFWIARLRDANEVWQPIALETLVAMVRERNASNRTLFALHQEFRRDPWGRLATWLLHFPDDESFALYLQTIRESTDEELRVHLLGKLRTLANDDDPNCLYYIDIDRAQALTRLRRRTAASALTGMLERDGDFWTKRVIRSVLETFKDER